MQTFSLENLDKTQFFELQDIETNLKRQNNPHYWLQQDILQIIQFQYRFFQNIILNEDIIPQINNYSQFLLKFFRFKYHFIREEQDQAAFKKTSDSRPYISSDTNIENLYWDQTSLQHCHRTTNSNSSCFKKHRDDDDNDKREA